MIGKYLTTTDKNIISKISNESFRQKFIKKYYNSSKKIFDLFNKSNSSKTILRTINKKTPINFTKINNENSKLINSIFFNVKTLENSENKKKSKIYHSSINNNLTKFETESATKKIKFLKTDPSFFNNKYNLALAYSENNMLEKLKQKNIFSSKKINNINSLYHQKVLLDLIKAGFRKNINTLNLDNCINDNSNINNNIFGYSCSNFLNYYNFIFNCNDNLNYNDSTSKEELNEENRYASEYRNKIVDKLKTMPNKNITDESVTDLQKSYKSKNEFTIPNIKQIKKIFINKSKLKNVLYGKDNSKNKNNKLIKYKRFLKKYNTNVLFKNKKENKTSLNEDIYQTFPTESTKNKQDLKKKIKTFTIKKPTLQNKLLTDRKKIAQKMTSYKKKRNGAYLKKKIINDHTNRLLFDNNIFFNNSNDINNKSLKKMNQKEMKKDETFHKIKLVPKLKKNKSIYTNILNNDSNPCSLNPLTCRSKEIKNNKLIKKVNKCSPNELKYHFNLNNASKQKYKYNKGIIDFNNLINDAICSLHSNKIISKNQQNNSNYIQSLKKTIKNKNEIKSILENRKKFNKMQNQQNKDDYLKLNKKNLHSIKISILNNNKEKETKKMKKKEIKLVDAVKTDTLNYTKKYLTEKFKLKNKNNLNYIPKMKQNNLNTKISKKRKILKLEIELDNKFSDIDCYDNTYSSFANKDNWANFSSFESNFINRTDEKGKSDSNITEKNFTIHKNNSVGKRKNNYYKSSL